ncbi:MAG: (2Fe-2S)-binding protein [Candidatus Eremiobacteraeota bacterium]|nr:(2Fe-2S)-binding protein [Candidatus Eremiobacteraeota bacterium]
MEITFTVNGREVKVHSEPERRLVDILRYDLALTGTKIGCGEGECGACTVIMDGLTVNSCLIAACQLQGSEVVTIEGLESSGKIGPVKEAFIEEGAVQCGFCIPGMVISAWHLLDKNPSPTLDEIRLGLSGNLCRCTGYKKIIEAVKKASQKRKGGELGK